KKLALQWQAAPPLPPAPALPDNAPRPDLAQLQALLEVVNMGYPRGVQRTLDRIETERPDCGAWLLPLRKLAQGFEFDRMTPWIQDAIARSEPA
ncbi:MAG: hypothetical protein KA141_10940, partial [Rubrivivax sp.]|nr:hypothetical protein [Rubrivivax sp.]